MTKEEMQKIAIEAVAKALEDAGNPSTEIEETGLPVVVCTKHKGVFFGYTDDPGADPMHLRRARMCVYWDSSRHGALGLASDGPGDSCRVSPAVGIRKLPDITCVMDATPKAVVAWESEPWG